VGARDHLYYILLKTEFIDRMRDEIFVVNEILLMKRDHQLQCVRYVFRLQIIKCYYCVRGGLRPGYTLHNQPIRDINAVQRLTCALYLPVLLQLFRVLLFEAHAQVVYVDYLLRGDRDYLAEGWVILYGLY
jgi:hypothetical protein